MNPLPASPPPPRLRFSALGGQVVVIHITPDGMTVSVNGDLQHTLPLDQAAERLLNPPCLYGVVTSDALNGLYPTRSAAEDKAADLRTTGLVASIIEVPTVLMTA